MHPFLQNLAYGVSAFVFLCGIVTAFVTYSIGRKTEKKQTVLKLAIFASILGLLSTIILWINNNKNNNEITDLKSEQYIQDSLYKKLEFKYDSTKIKLDSSLQQLSDFNESIQPRHLTDKQKTDFLTFINKYPRLHKNLPIAIRYISNDNEALEFANQLVPLFEKTNFKLQKPPLPVFRMGGRPLMGIIIMANNKIEKDPIHGGLIQEAFKSIGINAHGKHEEMVPEDFIYIFVGNKE